MFSAFDLWVGLGAVEVLFILSFIFFLLRINRPYVKTFFSTMTAKEFCVLSYRNAKSDRERIGIFDHHESYYQSETGHLRVVRSVFE
jgi:hypothetical protein